MTEFDPFAFGGRQADDSEMLALFRDAADSLDAIEMSGLRPPQ
jgi:hypothetical protein